jgi:hypothetical protein
MPFMPVNTLPWITMSCSSNEGCVLERHDGMQRRRSADRGVSGAHDRQTQRGGYSQSDKGVHVGSCLLIANFGRAASTEQPASQPKQRPAGGQNDDSCHREARFQTKDTCCDAEQADHIDSRQERISQHRETAVARVATPPAPESPGSPAGTAAAARRPVPLHRSFAAFE